MVYRILVTRGEFKEPIPGMLTLSLDHPYNWCLIATG